MKRLLMPFMLALAIFAGCNSSTGNDNNDENNNNNNNNTGNGGKYAVAGSVRLTSASGAAISGATVVLATASQTTVTPLTLTTGSDGKFSFGNVAAGNYVVTVTKSGYTFDPLYVAVTVTDKNVAVQTFVGTTVNTGGNAGSATLYPLKVNATWTFDSVMDAFSLKTNGTAIDKVTGTKSFGGKTYWMLTTSEVYSDETSYDDEAYFRVENNVLYSYGTDYLDKVVFKTAKPAQVANLQKMVQTGYGEYPLFKFNVAAGTTWDIYNDSGASGGNSYKYISTGKYVGTETVGAYANCAKYEFDYRSEGVYNDLKTGAKWLRTVWLAPNVGPVKTVEEFYFGETLADVSLFSTTTNTLKTVQLP